MCLVECLGEGWLTEYVSGFYKYHFRFAYLKFVCEASNTAEVLYVAHSFKIKCTGQTISLHKDKVFPKIL